MERYGHDVRVTYEQELSDIQHTLVVITQLVGEAVDKATNALLSDDLEAAQSVIQGDSRINELDSEIEEKCLRIAALQAPMATDLRLVMGAIRIASSLERMGDLASHIAKQVRLRYPNASIPIELHNIFREMGETAKMIVAATGRCIETRDTDLANDIKLYDDKLDASHRELFRIVLSDEWKHGVESAIDVTLLSRFYERFGDHAVTVARRIIYIVTGEPHTK